MKITLTHHDVLMAVRENLIRQGFNVPDSGTDSFGVFWDMEECQVTVEVDDISIAPHVPPEPAHTQAQAPAPVRKVNGRFDPGPSPPRERLDTPNRSLDDENKEGAIEGVVAQSEEFIRRIPDPTRVSHKAARDKFPRMQVAASIEEFGKDPTDFGDEV
jgi:hypothetical protein